MTRPSTRRVVSVLLVVAALIASAGYATAQFRGGAFEILGLGRGLAPAEFPDADFRICRLVYPEARRFAAGWRTDYPLGDRNLSIRLSELTRTPVSRAPDGSPNHYLVRIMDDQLFQCPFLIAGDVGSIGIGPAEAARLREYFLKGGFLWVDDMWGSAQWAAWSREIAKVFPTSEFPIVDVPVTDPIFQSQFVVDVMPQIPNISYWRGSGGDTSEQGADSAVPVFRAIRNEQGHIMIAMTHNTDIADAWEREGEDPEYYYRFSPTGYALGVNVLLHALTH